MKKILYFCILSITAFIVYVASTDIDLLKVFNNSINKPDIEKQEMKVKHESESTDEKVLSNEIKEMMEFTTDDVIQLLGEPNRIDPTPYNYEWYVYTDGQTYQIQIGLKDGHVNSIFTIGEGLNISPIKIGDDYDDVAEKYSFEKSLTYKDGLSYYTFKLKEEDIQTQPLIQISNDIFMQGYFDTFTNKLTAVRMIDAETLLQHRMYELEYRGPLPEEVDMDKEEWTEIESSMENEIYELTNVIRNQFQLNMLEKNEETSRVAFLHSKDMYDKQYFSHYRPNGDGLKERLDEHNVYYLAAGENIAAQHADGIAATFGWLNSEGHREALLNEEYTHLGVGVYRLYYTQNFLTKP